MPGALVSLLVALTASPGIVAIEPPTEWAEEARAKVVESCSRALGEGRCTLVGGSADAAPPYRASLLWDGESLRVTLLVTGSDAALAESSLHFSEADDETQRWVAAGLLVAALTVAETEAPEAAPPAEPPQPTPPPEPEPPLGPAVPPSTETPDLVPEEPQSWSSHDPVVVQLDAGLFGGPGLDTGTPRVGAALRGWVAPTGSRVAWTLAARGSRASASYQETEAAAGWLGGSLGLGLCVTACSGDGTLVLSGEGVVERAQLQLQRSDGAEQKALWRYGGRLGLTGAVRLSRAWGLWASADTTLLRPEIAVRVDSTPTDQESALRWTAGAGLRVYADPLFAGGP